MAFFDRFRGKKKSENIPSGTAEGMEEANEALGSLEASEEKKPEPPRLTDVENVYYTNLTIPTILLL